MKNCNVYFYYYIIHNNKSVINNVIGSRVELFSILRLMNIANLNKVGILSKLGRKDGHNICKKNRKINIKVIVHITIYIFMCLMLNTIV